MANSDKKNQNKNSIFTKETFGVVIVLFATLCLLCLITRDAIFSTPGQAINAFLFGCFGYFAFILCLYAIVKGVLLITDKKLAISRKRKVLLTLFFLLTALLCHLITMRFYSDYSYGEYLSESYLLASGGIATCSGGGVLTGIIAYPISLILTNVGGYVVLSVAIVIVSYFFGRDVFLVKDRLKSQKNKGFNSSFVKTGGETIDINVNPVEERDYPVSNAFDGAGNTGTQKLFIVNSNDFAFKTGKDYKMEAKNQGVKYNFNSTTKTFEPTQKVTYSKTHDKVMQDKLDYIKTPARININTYQTESTANGSVTISDAIKRSNAGQTVEPVTRLSVSQTPVVNTAPTYESQERTTNINSATSHAEQFSNLAGVEEFTPETPQVVEKAEDVFAINEGRGRNLNVEDIPFTGETDCDEESIDNIEPSVMERNDSGLFGASASEIDDTTPSMVTDRRSRDIFFNTQDDQPIVEEKQEEKTEEKPAVSATSTLSLSERLAKYKEEKAERLRQEEKAKEEQLKAEIEEKKKQVVLPPVHVPYVAPKLDLLFDYKPDEDQPPERHEEKMDIIIKTLDSFRIKAEGVGWIQGPTVTRYELRMPIGTPVTSVLKYDDDLKMWLSSREGVMIQAPIPGKDLIGVEVANQSRVKVGLKELMKGLESAKRKDDSIYFVLGKDVVGNPVEDELGKGPHYLVAGTTGSGKSVCLNVMLTSMIMRYSPEDLRLIIVDPKHVDYAVYEHLPHLLVDEIIDKPEKVVAALGWLYEEAERRFEMFKQAGGYAKIEEYNKYVANDTIPKMPRILMVIDEVADLMQSYKKEMESKIVAIAQKARAAGVHLILATQYPRGDIISTPIKANLPGRIALRVTSGSASQLMLDQPGAEKLLGYGDMLYRNNLMSEPIRYQGGIIETAEIRSIVKDIIANNKAYFNQSLTECLAEVDKPQEEAPTFVETTSGIDSSENKDLFVKALALAIDNGIISISYLQRHFQIGYARAGGLIDKMERSGYISSAADGSNKGRKVYITREEFMEKFGQDSEEEFGS